MVGEDRLLIQLTSQINGLSCRALLAGEPLEPIGFKTARWTGPARSWPPDDQWTPDGAAKWIAEARAR